MLYSISLLPAGTGKDTPPMHLVSKWSRSECICQLVVYTSRLIARNKYRSGNVVNHLEAIWCWDAFLEPVFQLPDATSPWMPLVLPYSQPVIEPLFQWPCIRILHWKVFDSDVWMNLTFSKSAKWSQPILVEMDSHLWDAESNRKILEYMGMRVLLFQASGNKLLLWTAVQALHIWEVLLIVEASFDHEQFHTSANLQITSHNDDANVSTSLNSHFHAAWEGVIPRNRRSQLWNKIGVGAPT